MNVVHQMPADLTCMICYDLVIDPVVLSTEDETKVCNHIVCNVCEQTKRMYDKELRQEIQCAFCKRKYSRTILDEATIAKVKEYIQKRPDVFGNKTYEDIVEQRKTSAYIKILMEEALDGNDQEKASILAQEIKKSSERDKIFSKLAVSQFNKPNCPHLAFCINSISSQIWKVKVFSMLGRVINENFWNRDYKEIIEATNNALNPESQYVFDMYTLTMHLNNLIGSNIPDYITRQIKIIEEYLTKCKESASKNFYSKSFSSVYQPHYLKYCEGFLEEHKGNNSLSKEIMDSLVQDIKKEPNKIIKLCILSELLTRDIEVNGQFFALFEKELDFFPDDISRSVKSYFLTVLAYPEYFMKYSG